MSDSSRPKEKLFSPYQVFVIAILSIIQFSVILDFMVLSPLGAIVDPKRLSFALNQPSIMEDKGAASDGVVHADNSYSVGAGQAGMPQGQDGPEIESLIVPALIRLHTGKIQKADGKSTK